LMLMSTGVLARFAASLCLGLQASSRRRCWSE
jgi:hypothetical protein